jgi:hypothetical protein
MIDGTHTGTPDRDEIHDRLLEACTSLAASLHPGVRQALLDGVAAVTLDLARSDGDAGYLQRADAYRAISRTCLHLSPLEVDARVAGRLHAALYALDADDPDLAVDRLLAVRPAV